MESGSDVTEPAVSAYRRRAAGLFLAGLMTAISAVSAAAASHDNTAAMMKLDPSARIEQRCNARGMGVVEREHKGMRPDELVAYAYANTVIDHDRIKAPGAAVRSGGDWYHLSYVCQTANDGMDVTSFTYTLGGVIPHSEWGEHYLVAP